MNIEIEKYITRAYIDSKRIRKEPLFVHKINHND